MYRELCARSDLSAVVVCEWERICSGDIVVLPDGCVDLVWRSDGTSFVAGPDLGPIEHAAAGVSFVGVRLTTGAAGSVLGVDADALVDQRVELDALWGRFGSELGDRLNECRSHVTRREILAGAVRSRLTDVDVDTAVIATARALTVGSERVPDLAEHVGLSHRQLHRRFVRQVGYAPKQFAGVARFRRFLALGDGNGVARNLATLAVESGYSDQAHLTRECRRLAGRTPRELLQAP
jgi:AraC-like DNA-binding protein